MKLAKDVMAHPSSPREVPFLLSPSTPQFTSGHRARTPSRSPTRVRIVPDDIFSDLSPTSTLEAFTSGSGVLKASIEAASSTERAFGIKAAVASKNIHEWVTEISNWPWPKGAGSAGFEVPQGIRRRAAMLECAVLDDGNEPTDDQIHEGEYWGSLSAEDVLGYETRLDDISEKMEALDVEEIKSQVLSTHISGTSRPGSSSGMSQSPTPSFHSVTRLTDLTAVVTTIVLKTLPSLSRLVSLMNIWSVRLAILKQVTPLMVAFDDAEIALQSGWKAIGQSPKLETVGLEEESSAGANFSLSQETREIMRRILQTKVTQVGQLLDHMLDALEGRDDTLPNSWLDRMEKIEEDYGEWVVSGERKVQESEWVKELRPREHSKVSKVGKGDPIMVTTSAPQVLGNVNLQSSDDAEPGNGTFSRLGEYREQTKLSSDTATGRPFSAETESIDGARDSRDCPQPKFDEFLAPTYDEPSPNTGEDAMSSPDSDNVMADDMSAHDSTSSPPDQSTDSNRFEHQTPEKNSLIPLEAQASSERSISFALKSPSNQPVHDSFLEDGGTPRSPSKKPLFDRSTPSPHFVASSRGLADPFDSNLPSEIKMTDLTVLHAVPDHQAKQSELSLRPGVTIMQEDSLLRKNVSGSKPANCIDHSPSIPPTTSGVSPMRKSHPVFPSGHISNAVPDISPRRLVTWLEATSANERPERPKRFSLTSEISEYASSEPTPEIYEAEPTEYFRPHVSPVISVRNSPRKEDITTPTVRLDETGQLSNEREVTTPTKASFLKSQSSPQVSSRDLSVAAEEGKYGLPSSHSPRHVLSFTNPTLQSQSTKNAIGATTYMAHSHKTSASSIETVFHTPRHGKEDFAIGNSVYGTPDSSNDLNTDFYEMDDDLDLPMLVTPTRTPRADNFSVSSTPDFEDESPSIGRTRVHDTSGNYSPQSPTNPIPAISQRRLRRIKSPDLDSTSLAPRIQSSPLSQDAPLFPNVEVSASTASISPQKTSDLQLQEQISEILGSIPARIILESRLGDSLSSKVSTIHAKKRVTSSSRASSRASTPTPSFTLAPAHSKNSRPRPQKGNPEIKVYHLSRNTGEAPIKLFVRSVGENGDRVMVRVGGGWADLGAYLKEYALHHGRRPDKDESVEIQGAPSPSNSTGTASTHSGLRSGAVSRNGRSSPISRPESSLDRPMSSFADRKTRKSTGDMMGSRSPSNPLPPGSVGFLRSTPSRMSMHETSTPNSTQSYVSSQFSWTTDHGDRDTELGLAGPRGRDTAMSPESMAWVESMKEKVRVASAEKEKEREKKDFGGLGKVGTTKRLFKKTS